MDTDKLLERIDVKLDRVEIRLEGYESRLDAIQIAGALHGQVLEDHQRRSLASEQALDVLKKEQEAFRALVKERALIWVFVGRVVAGIGVGAGAVGAVYKLWQMLYGV